MILWTIQPVDVYEKVQTDGVYHSDFEKSRFCHCKEQYDWLVQEMKKKIGNPPKGVDYPVYVSNVSDSTKDNIYRFIEDSKRTVFLEDCENSDPYALCAAVRKLDPGRLSRIDVATLICAK